MNNDISNDDPIEPASPPDLARTVEAAIAIDHAFEIVDNVLARDPQTRELREALDRVPVRRVLRLVRESAQGATRPTAS